MGACHDSIGVSEIGVIPPPPMFSSPSPPASSGRHIIPPPKEHGGHQTHIQFGVSVSHNDQHAKGERQGHEKSWYLSLTVFQITQTMRKMKAVKRRLMTMTARQLLALAPGGWCRLCPPRSPGWTRCPSSPPSRSPAAPWWSPGSRTAGRPPAPLKRKIKTQGII